MSSKVELKDINLEQDLELLFAWRSHPKIYKWFYEQDGPLKWKNHYEFWHSRSDRKDWMIVFEDRKVGSASVVGLSQEAPDVGIYIGEITLWGEGVGEKSLLIVLNWLKKEGYDKAQARIHQENTPSIKLFEKVGFRYQNPWSENENWFYYIKEF